MNRRYYLQKFVSRFFFQNNFATLVPQFVEKKGKVTNNAGHLSH